MSDKPTIRLKFKDSGDEASRAPQVPAKPAPRSQSSAPKPKPHPPLLGTEPLVVKCGHSIAFELYVKDAFRDQRRAKAVQRDCPPCRQARVESDAAAAKERRAKKKATFAKALKPRLPDGARFSATYDAAAVQWTGTLTVEGATYERQGSSLNKLLHKLDDVYRATKNPAPVEAPAPAAP